MKKKKVYKNRDSKDLNDNYTFVKPEILKEFKGTHEEFLAKITHLKPGYLKKENGRIIVHLWWEDKDMWFMNHGEQRIISERKSNFTSYGWFIEKDILTILKSMIRQDDLIMYFKK